MDLFLRGVPVNLSNDNLKTELQPFMNTLGVLDWACQKPRNKNFAFLHFLQVADGTKFLDKHGVSEKQVSLPDGQIINSSAPSSKGKPSCKIVKTPRLVILRSEISVAKSNRPVDPATLNHLQYTKESRLTKVDRNSKAPSLRAKTRALACGKITFVQKDTLTFVREAEFNDVVRRVSFARQGLTLFLGQTHGHFRMQCPYETIENVFADISGQELTFVLSHPPRMYLEKSEDLDRGTIDTLERVSHIPGWSSHGHHEGYCLVYRIWFSEPIGSLTRQLIEQDKLVVERSSIPMTVPLSLCPELDTNAACMARLSRQTEEKTGWRSPVPFILLFQLERMVWDNYVHPDTAERLLHAMEQHIIENKKNKTDLHLTTDSIKRVLQQIPYPQASTLPEDLDAVHILGSFIAEEQKALRNDPNRTKDFGARIPPNQVWTLRATVTPTRITLSGPDPESGNRVLRKFPNHSTYFMRVTFADEDGQDIFHVPKVSNERVFERYREVLNKGIKVAGRAFVFLGFSHSSLRSHSAWFIAPFIDDNGQRQDRETILKTLGHFDSIRIPAKCAARIGQAFSETPFAVDIFKHNINVHYIKDVKSGDRVLSDGVGTISLGAAEVLWAQHPALRSATCFQIRWAGCKGMLSLDTTLNGKLINIRKESMQKFESEDHAELGLCDAATRPFRLVLNRQMIKILEDMGTDKGWFFRLQEKAVRMLKEVTAQAANTATFLEYQLVGTSFGFPQFVRQLDKMGIDYRRDKFLKSVVEHVVLRELRLLKHKARIPVDNGVTLFGVLDETGFLEEGEVYFTFDQTHGRKHAKARAPQDGDAVIITRSPALHPGDIQVARLVKPHESHPLCQLRNCVVFSQQGTRGLPSQLSGGDLDGDLYNLIWDHDAMPRKIFLPADYPTVKPPELKRTVTREDIADFFVNFMRTDILGVIANRHQIMADIRENGTLDPTCVQLAEMHSTAVDYSKTGIPVDVKTLPRPPISRPDFLAPAPPLKLYDLGQIEHIADEPSEDEDDEYQMGRSRPRYHGSEKILGQLYRAIDEKKIWAENIQRSIDAKGPSVWEQLSGLVQAELRELCFPMEVGKSMEEAERMKTLYDDSMENLSWQFCETSHTALTEVETFCGSILNKTGSQTRRQRDSSIKLKEEADRTISWVIELIRERGSDEHPDGAAAECASVIQLCLACIAAGTDKTGGRQRKPPQAGREWPSFKVVASCCLMKEMRILRELQLEKDNSLGGGYVGVGSRKEATSSARQPLPTREPNLQQQQQQASEEHLKETPDDDDDDTIYADEPKPLAPGEKRRPIVAITAVYRSR